MPFFFEGDAHITYTGILIITQKSSNHGFDLISYELPPRVVRTLLN